MSAFEDIVIGKSSVPSLIITVILMIAIPVCFFLFWRRKHKEQTKISWLIAGAIGFIVSARVLELAIHYLCIVMDNPVSRFINGNTAAYVLYGTLTGTVLFHDVLQHDMPSALFKHPCHRDSIQNESGRVSVDEPGDRIIHNDA